MKWRVVVSVTALCLTSLGLALDCRQPNRDADSGPLLTVQMRWSRVTAEQLRHLRPGEPRAAIGTDLWPYPKVSGPLMDRQGKPMAPTVFSTSEKIIDGTACVGFLVHHGEGARDEAPEDRVLSFYVPKERKPENRSHIYVSCKVPIRIQIAHFEGGRIVNKDTRKTLKRPYILEPGDYHLQVFGPQASASPKAPAR